MEGKILFAVEDGVHVLKFVGDVRVTLGPTISAFLEKIADCQNFHSVVIDLSETVGIDSTSLGLLAKIAMKVQESFGAVPTILSTNDDITRVLLTMGFDQVFVIVREDTGILAATEALPCRRISEGDMRTQVLDAHRTLMTMNEGNRVAFRDLVGALEVESGLN